MLLTTSLQVIYSISQTNENGAYQYNIWQSLFYDALSEDNIYYFYTIWDLQDQLLGIFETISDFDTVSLQDLMLNDKSIGILEFYPYFPFQGLNYTSFSSYQYMIDLDVGIVKPFNLSDADSLKSWIQDVRSFNIKLYNVILYNQYHTTCFNITMSYEMQVGITAKSIIDGNGGDCSEYNTEEELDDIDRRIRQRYKAFPGRSQQSAIKQSLTGKNIVYSVLTIILASASVITSTRYGFPRKRAQRFISH